MHRVLEHIDRHLDQPLGLDSLARVAHFSAFHFHRLFTAWMGETLGEYLRRRRLEVAAQRLIAQPGVSVLHVALSVGFGSPEAFARAFKARFGCTATAWRSTEAARRFQLLGFGRADRPTPGQNSKNGQANSSASQAAGLGEGNHEASHNRTPEASMNVKLIDRKPTPIAYLRHIGPYGQPVSDFWQQTVYPWMVTNDLLGYPRLGISHDDPGIAAPDTCRYDACVEVPPGFKGSGKYLETTVPGGKYAAARFAGTVVDIVEAWAVLLRDWLPASGMQLDSRPLLEFYGPGSTFDPQTGVFDCDLCIPVSPL